MFFEIILIISGSFQDPVCTSTTHDNKFYIQQILKSLKLLKG